MSIADHLQKGLGLSLHAQKGTTELHGYLNGNHFAAGKKEPMNYNNGKYWCNEDLDEGEHTCIILILYEEIEAIAGVDLPNQKDIGISQKPHPKLDEVHKHVQGAINAYSEQNGLVNCWHEVDEKMDEHLDFFIPHG